ncbi:hypothetical protein M9458_046134, partial [Cirrhinus mrigala]
SNVDSLLRLRGRLLLDHEALSCLLVLLFVDEPKLNTSRLHRVLRNFLLSILQRSSESELCLETARLEEPGLIKWRKGLLFIPAGGCSLFVIVLLVIFLFGAFQSALLAVCFNGRRFGMQDQHLSDPAGVGKKTHRETFSRREHELGRAWRWSVRNGSGSTVHIHPQAAPVVCRHVLDTLIQLAK